jgi:autotransporter-associated beta strand protein
LGDDARVMFTAAPGEVNGVMKLSYANGVDFASYDTDKGVVAFGSVASGFSYTNPTSVDNPASTDTVLINGTTTDTTLNGAKQYNALKIDGAQTIDLNGCNLTIGQTDQHAMILKTGAGQAEIAGNTGTINGSPSRANYSVRVNEGTLKLTTRVNMPDQSHFGKSGPGLLWIAPGAAWTGISAAYGEGIYFAEGAIRINPTDANLGGASAIPMYLNGGVMEITGGGTYSPTLGDETLGRLRWVASGGFAAYGADAAFGTSITWGDTLHVPNGCALLLNSDTANSAITLSGAINLGTDPGKMYLREICVAENASETGDKARISGQISGVHTYPLVKTGAGELVLSHSANTYEGRTYVKQGKLTIEGNIASSPLEVMNSATVKVAAAATAHAAAGLKMVSGATLEIDRSGGEAGRLAVSGTVVLGGATLSISGSGSVPNSFILFDNDGSDSVAGAFAGLDEGGTINIGGTDYAISYVAGDGNDVTLRKVIRGTVIVVR